MNHHAARPNMGQAAEASWCQAIDRTPAEVGNRWARGSSALPRTKRVEPSLHQRLLRAHRPALHILQCLQHQLQHLFPAGQRGGARRRLGKREWWHRVPPAWRVVNGRRCCQQQREAGPLLSRLLRQHLAMLRIEESGRMCGLPHEALPVKGDDGQRCCRASCHHLLHGCQALRRLQHSHPAPLHGTVHGGVVGHHAKAGPGAPLHAGAGTACRQRSRRHGVKRGRSRSKSDG